MSTVPVFQLKDVTLAPGPNFQLGPLSLDVQEGQTLVLLGPSGCGKSTLLRLLLGLLSPDSGQVFFRGQLLERMDSRSLRRKAGYVVQGGGLFPHLTARGNVALLAEQSGMSRTWVAGRLNELTALTRFPTEAQSRYPSELSGGQRQRVGLMRALMLDPEVLFLDEPLGALDPITRYDLQRDLKDAFARVSKTVVLVTHDLSEAAFFADRVVLMRDGQVVQQGSIRSLLTQPKEPFVERFIAAQRPTFDERSEGKGL